MGYQNELDTGGILNDSNDRTFLTLNWTPVEEQTCLTITYIHELTSSVNYNNIEITIADGYSDEIANVQLENGVSSIGTFCVMVSKCRRLVPTFKARISLCYTDIK